MIPFKLISCSLILFVTLSMCCKLGAQQVAQDSSVANALRLNAYRIDELADTLSPAEKIKLYRAAFQQILTGRDGAIPAASAAIDIVKPTVQIRPVITIGNSILAPHVSGNLTDGYVGLFSNSRLNYGLDLGVDWHYAIGPDEFKRRSGYYASELYSYRLKEQEIKIDSLKDVVNHRIDKVALGLKLQLKAATEKERSLRTKLARVSGGLAKDSLSMLLAYTLIDTKRISEQLQFAENVLFKTDRPLAARRNLNSRKDSLDRKFISPQNFSLQWFTVGLSLLHESILQFYPENSFERQVERNAYSDYALRIAYSVYKHKIEDAAKWYISGSAKFGRSADLSGLSQRTLRNVTSFPGLDGQSTREVVEQYTVFLGTFQQRVSTIDLAVDYYRFLGSRSRLAIHGYPGYRIAQNSKPVTNLGIGFLVLLPNHEAPDRPVNLELYYDAIDVFGTGNSALTIFERNGIGLRLAVPLTLRHATKK